MTEKHPSKMADDAENASLQKDDSNAPSSIKVPNPFEKKHGELSQETLDSIEQFKEAQTERD